MLLEGHHPHHLATAVQEIRYLHDACLTEDLETYK